MQLGYRALLSMYNIPSSVPLPKHDKAGTLNEVLHNLCVPVHPTSDVFIYFAVCVVVF